VFRAFPSRYCVCTAATRTVHGPRRRPAQRRGSTLAVREARSPLKARELAAAGPALRALSSSRAEHFPVGQEVAAKHESRRSLQICAPLIRATGPGCPELRVTGGLDARPAARSSRSPEAARVWLA
jgi:hypothetical protein